MDTSAIHRHAIVLFFGALLPFAAVVPGFLWLGYGAGAEWAYLLPKEHWLNFGGNPAEVLSHLLDWLFMIGGTLGVAWAWWLVPSSSTSPLARWAPFVAQFLGFGALTILGAAIDFKKGEGTFLIVCGIYFLPFLGGANFILRPLSNVSSMRRLPPLFAFVGASLGLQLVCEPSDTGGPDGTFILVAPAMLLLCLGIRRLFTPAAPQTALS